MASSPAAPQDLLSAGDAVGRPLRPDDSMVFPNAVTSQDTRPSVRFSFQLRVPHSPGIQSRRARSVLQVKSPGYFLWCSDALCDLRSWSLLSSISLINILSQINWRAWVSSCIIFSFQHGVEWYVFSSYLFFLSIICLFCLSFSYYFSSYSSSPPPPSASSSALLLLLLLILLRQLILFLLPLLLLLETFITYKKT